MQYTYSMDRLLDDHERGNIMIARHNVPMYKIQNKVEDEVYYEDETNPPPRCPPKEPLAKPAEPCIVAASGLAAI